MLKIYVDDLRKFPDKKFNYNCFRSYEECINWLEFYNEVDVINLDYNLGTYTGLDILIFMKKHNICVKKIIVHSTNVEGIKIMEKYIKENFSDSKYLYCGFDE